MADKCWCEKELEAVPSGGNPQEFDGAAECPDHGADYVWRPCGERGTHTDEVDGSHLPISWCRYLTRVFGARIPVSPLMCGDCDRPALVEAVRAVVVLKLMGDGFRSVHPSLGAQCEAALAAVDRPGEEARDAT